MTPKDKPNNTVTEVQGPAGRLFKPFARQAGEASPYEYGRQFVRFAEEHALKSGYTIRVRKAVTETFLTLAGSEPILDGDGNPVKDKDGKVLRRLVVPETTKEHEQTGLEMHYHVQNQRAGEVAGRSCNDYAVWLTADMAGRMGGWKQAIYGDKGEVVGYKTATKSDGTVLGYFESKWLGQMARAMVWREFLKLNDTACEEFGPNGDYHNQVVRFRKILKPLIEAGLCEYEAPKEGLEASKAATAKRMAKNNTWGYDMVDGVAMSPSQQKEHYKGMLERYLGGATASPVSSQPQQQPQQQPPVTVEKVVSLFESAAYKEALTAKVEAGEMTPELSELIRSVKSGYQQLIAQLGLDK